MSGQVLDDSNVLKERDPDGALELLAGFYEQFVYEPAVAGKLQAREVKEVIVTGMGGSALAALIARVYLKAELNIPFEIVRSYSLPQYIGKNTLVIASSYSGNTEETVSALEQAEKAGSLVSILASGGKLIDIAKAKNLVHVQLPGGLQPRMALVYNLVALFKLLETFGIASHKVSEVHKMADFIQKESSNWLADVPVARNYAKEIAMKAVGKNAVFYGGELTAPLAYKWKISWNETGKNVAWWNEYSEFNHNEFMGWTSHPVEKPYAVFDLISNFEHPQILKRFQISNKLLSGKRPASTAINLKGDNLLEQLLWGAVLADFASVYLAILNKVNPVPVVLIEKLKKELV